MAKRNRTIQSLDATRLRELWEAGVPTPEIAKRMGSCRSSIQRKAREIGLPLRGRAVSDALLDGSARGSQGPGLPKAAVRPSPAAPLMLPICFRPSETSFCRVGSLFSHLVVPRAAAAMRPSPSPLS